MRKLGIIGGMGPLAGCEFYRMLIEATPAKCDQDHFDVILSGHASIPDRTEAVESGDASGLIAAIAEDIELFANNKVGLITMTCNTSHSFYSQLQELSPIPFFNMVKNAVHGLKENFHDKQVTLFSTRGTYFSNVYLDYARALGLDLRYPEDEDIEVIMRSIYHVKKTQETRIPQLDPLLDRYTANNGLVLLACTELSVLELPDKYHASVADSMEMMVNAVVKLMTADDGDFQAMLPRYTGGPE
jgi:aspartate racemase